MSTTPPYSFIRSAPMTGSSMLAKYVGWTTFVPATSICSGTGHLATNSLWPSANRNFSTEVWISGATPLDKHAKTDEQQTSYEIVSTSYGENYTGPSLLFNIKQINNWIN
ncbi:hypothetical protein TYRP_023682 [Tyrophagus putrescentiae]|nr:hypothetical protein TYRP_023682 [Tyrophagus putrescentiae]